MKVTLAIAIPAYNESTTISRVVTAVAAQHPLVRQIIVVNDGSTDSTADALSDLQNAWQYQDVQLVVIHFEHNCGKGAAVRAALEHSREPYFLIQDADLELDPQDYPRLIEPLARGDVSIVFGNRFGDSGSIRVHWLSRLANWIVTMLPNLLFGMNLKDEACGFKLLPTALARELNLQSQGFEICSEITAKIARRHLPVANVDVRYHPRTVLQGKKIRWIDGFKAVFALVRYRV